MQTQHYMRRKKGSGKVKSASDEEREAFGTGASEEVTKREQEIVSSLVSMGATEEQLKQVMAAINSQVGAQVDLSEFRIRIYELIKEELEELKQAITNKDLLEVADALTDILYVTYGAGHAFGIDLDSCFDEVQNSNMSKLGKDGKPIYNEAGKVMKGPNYFKPDLSKFIR